MVPVAARRFEPRVAAAACTHTSTQTRPRGGGFAQNITGTRFRMFVVRRNFCASASAVLLHTTTRPFAAFGDRRNTAAAAVSVGSSDDSERVGTSRNVTRKSRNSEVLGQIAQMKLLVSTNSKATQTIYLWLPAESLTL